MLVDRSLGGGALRPWERYAQRSDHLHETDICFLQGIGVLPGSFITGQIRWAVYGGIAVAAGISILVALRESGRAGRMTDL